MTLKQKVLLVGAGPMAIDYAKVLTALGADMIVIGRGTASAANFTAKTAVDVVTGGLDQYLSAAVAVPTSAIVAVGVEALAHTTIQLLKRGVRHILLEKPGALTRPEIHEIKALAQAQGARVLIAYNRRFYAATMQAEQLVKADGGVKSMHFEFTEWDHVIRNIPKADGVKEAWLLANSTHVIDLAFYLGGSPSEWHGYASGALEWHPTGSAFAGAGRTDRGVLFSYQANWDGPGRWGVEIITCQSRLIFRPMESLQIMRKGSVAIETVPLNDELDKTYKPGLYEQTRCFITGELERFCTVEEQVEKWDTYSKIAGYPVV
jgi:predicted dehydrogenase